MDEQARRQLDDLLARDMDAVAVAPPRVAHPGDVAVRWDLPARDVDALVRWGLPVTNVDGADSHMPSADFQEELLPRLDATGARGFSGGTDPDKGKAYQLSTSWLRSYGAVEGDGAVWGIPKPGNSTGGLVNTSVAAYVETVWRWWRICDLIEPLEEVEDYDTYNWCLEKFSEWAVELDPEAKARSVAEKSWWESIAWD